MTVRLVAWIRLARHWPSITAAALLLGVGFGLSLACFATARTTMSAYDRILDATDAPDAAVALGFNALKGEEALSEIDGIVSQRVYAGFVGRADGLAPILSTAIIAPIRDRFPLETPKLTDGRMPNQDAADEVFVNTLAAERGNLRVGQELRFHLFNPYSGKRATVDVHIVGIGTVASETVADETGVLGVFVFTRAFFVEHRDLTSYASSNVDLAPGFDANHDLIRELEPRDLVLQSARGREHHAVVEALRPFTIVVVALGILGFIAMSVGAGQVVQRNRERWGPQSATLRTLGMTRGQVHLVELTTSAVLALFTVVATIVTMLVVSPLAPLGPLHDFDPAQGVGIDWPVALVGVGAIVTTLFVLTLAWSSVRRPARRPPTRHGTWLPAGLSRPTSIAGLVLALRSDDGRRRVRRAFSAPTAATVVLALAAAFIASAITLTSTPARYGFDAELLALNAYGDQDPETLQRLFGENPDVEAATAYTASAYVIAKQSVPGLAMTTVKGDLTLPLLRGRPPQAADEIVLGADTLERLDARVNDVVSVQVSTASYTDAGLKLRLGKVVNMRVVGVATFPSVIQVGTDTPRLGTGALVTRDAYLAMDGEPGNQPEFTMATLRPGADPQKIIAANPEPFQDLAQSATGWYTDAKAAELQQLDAALPYLRGSLAVGYAILLIVLMHALWNRARASRRPLAVLRAIGCTRSQLDGVMAWQAAPYVVGTILIGLPVGIILGRVAFSFFARSLAVADDATTTVGMLAALLGAIALAAAVAVVVGIAGARRRRAALREE